MSYTCPDCEDGVLVAKVREIPIADDETAEITKDGRVQITTVRCNNGCSPESEEEEEEEKPKRKKRTPPKAWVEAPGQHQCPKSELCSNGPGHRGRCNTKLAERVEA